MFAYCTNDPVNNEDPDGFFPIKALVKGAKKLWPVAKKQIPRVYKIARKNITSKKYKVGSYNKIKGVKGLDAHHVGQKAGMKKLVKNYDHRTAPAINVPRVGHTVSKKGKGVVSRSTKGITSARQLLARDIRELRRVYPNIPNSSLQKLIKMNKKMYPEMRK